MAVAGDPPEQKHCAELVKGIDMEKNKTNANSEV
jgi:hypothetical protein